MKIGSKTTVVYEVWITYQYLDRTVDNCISESYSDRKKAIEELDEFVSNNISRSRLELANNNLEICNFFITRAKGAYIKEIIIKKD